MKLNRIIMKPIQQLHCLNRHLQTQIKVAKLLNQKYQHHILKLVKMKLLFIFEHFLEILYISQFCPGSHFISTSNTIIFFFFGSISNIIYRFNERTAAQSLMKMKFCFFLFWILKIHQHMRRRWADIMPMEV